MAQTTILAAAQTTATSTDVVVPAGAVVTIGLFATGDVPPQARAAVYIDTPSGDQFVKFLQGNPRQPQGPRCRLMRAAGSISSSTGWMTP